MLLSNRKRSKFFKSWPQMREKETKTSRANRKITGCMLHTFNICNIYINNQLNIYILYFYLWNKVDESILNTTGVQDKY